MTTSAIPDAEILWDRLRLARSVMGRVSTAIAKRRWNEAASAELMAERILDGLDHVDDHVIADLATPRRDGLIVRCASTPCGDVATCTIHSPIRHGIRVGFSDYCATDADRVMAASPDSLRTALYDLDPIPTQS